MVGIEFTRIYYLRALQSASQSSSALKRVKRFLGSPGKYQTIKERAKIRAGRIGITVFLSTKILQLLRCSFLGRSGKDLGR